MSDGDERDIKIARLRQENDRLRAENNALRPLVAVLNAALEHVPPQTKAILSEMAQPRVKEIEDALKPNDAASEA